MTGDQTHIRHKVPTHTMKTSIDSLSNLNLAPAMTTRPPAAASPSTAAQTQRSSDFTQALVSSVQATTAASATAPTEQAEQAAPYLLATSGDSAANRSAKPSIADFMRATDTDFHTASSTLYGVIGSNQDLRDWNAIMAADDPLLAARQATGALYASDLAYGNANSFHPSEEQTLASSGSFAWLDVDSRQGLWLMDGQGGALRQLPLSAPDILRAARDFGADPADLEGLADQMDTKGLSYQPAGMQNLDLRNLAQGGKGSNTDWTSDPLAHLKGDSGMRTLAANIQLARELGLATAGGGNTSASPPLASNSTDSGTSDVAKLTQQLSSNLLALQTALQELQGRADTTGKTS